jgi:hypothetical protein
LKLVGLGCVHLLPSQKIYLHWLLLIEEGDTVVDMEEAVKETVAVAENGNPTKIEILETETEMKTEIELVIYVIVNEQNRMLLDTDMVQFYPMLMMSN